MIWLALAACPAAALAGWWLWLRDRRAATVAAAVEAARVTAALAAFQARATDEVAANIERAAALIVEESHAPPPNVDLGRDRAGVRERLLRAAYASGGDEARTQLAQLLDAADAADASPR